MITNAPVILRGGAFGAVLLPEGIRRGLAPAIRERSPDFLPHYEDRVLFYDVFWDAAGERVILHGPPPIDLVKPYRAARYFAVPSGTPLRARGHHSDLVNLISLGAPRGTTHIDIDFAGTRQRAAIGASHADWFAGENLLFTLSKDNDLAWIADWARFHVRHQGVSAVLLFDNDSSRYGPGEIEAALAAVPGLRRLAVVPVPFVYPMRDLAVAKHTFWAHFLQPSVIVNMFRRYGVRAAGILNADIDELFVPLGSETVFEAARKSRSGTCYYRPAWVEPVPETPRTQGYRHRDFRRLAAGSDITQGRTAKWVMAPDRRWLDDLRIHPYPHLIVNRPMLTRHRPDNAYIAHFKAISTNWKYDRLQPPAQPPVLDTALARALDAAFPPDQ